MKDLLCCYFLKYDVHPFTNDCGQDEIFSFDMQDNINKINFLIDDDYL